MYPRKRWASNIKNFTTTVTIPQQANGGYNTVVLCENSTQTATPTPTILKFGRLKIRGDVRYTVTGGVQVYTSAIMYVVFVPQGNTLNIDLIENHPEYILGWTTLSMDGGNTFSLSSALKRNLNSGDSIQVYIGANTVTTSTAQMSFNFFYNCQFWTTSA